MNTPYAVAAFSIILAAVIAYVVRLGNTIQEMRNEITKLTVQVSPLWATVQASISRDLHQPHPRYAEMDGLLERLEALTISEQERGRLKALLLERSTDTDADITEEQRKKAKAMILIMDIVVLEADRKETGK